MTPAHQGPYQLGEVVRYAHPERAHVPLWRIEALRPTLFYSGRYPLLEYGLAPLGEECGLLLWVASTAVSTARPVSAEVAPPTAEVPRRPVAADDGRRGDAAKARMRAVSLARWADVRAGVRNKPQVGRPKDAS